ncbi:hypothetical protein P4S93_06900 [Aneurinibacillus thermoaerophilus]|uniref:Uncharacterized protein n=3 Tax=Aneurinibacillus thermoaerophilus TaxID=143495 RepID=A0A1G7XD98_ANETH|nr:MULTISPECIES: hypothetical protein [Aneurinibacillus]MED0758821.1 hypothetical protein [Aneurinibacillus thermoaerophilus]MED0760502.1 hypothetical protein [Aneurinibacillus thermoaerophilus]SDG81560.1 hypothetical protein SAMN04489735_1003122 [Aneurinibacillus thermoaerophilus]
MYRECRNCAGLSIEVASEEIGVAPRTLNSTNGDGRRMGAGS